jgi:hypothetical protein
MGPGPATIGAAVLSGVSDTLKLPEDVPEADDLRLMAEVSIRPVPLISTGAVPLRHISISHHG